MHLCYLLPPFEPFSPQTGGALATFSFQQGRRLQKLGHRVSVIAPQTPAPTYDLGQVRLLPGVTREALSPLARALSTRVRRRLSQHDWLYYEHYQAQFSRALQELRPDAILCFNDWHTPRDAKAACPDARVFLRLSNECNTRLNDIAPALEAIETIFALSQYVRRWTMERFAIPQSRFELLPNGADLDSFFPAPDAFERVLDAQRPVRALFISRLDPNKGPDLAADAVHLVQQMGLAVELSVAGNVWFRNDDAADESPFVRAVRAKAERAGAHLLGHVERPAVPALVRDHDVLLLPIRNNDPMTQVVFEAMASGLALISCPLGGVPEACGDAALWAKPDDAASVAALLRQLCEDRALLVQWKQRARARAQEMTWDHNAAIFQRVLTGKPSDEPAGEPKG